LDDLIYIPDRKFGNYSIAVVPEPDAKPTDTYTLQVWAENKTWTLAENVEIEDIPIQPYTIRSTETEIIVEVAPPAPVGGIIMDIETSTPQVPDPAVATLLALITIAIAIMIAVRKQLKT
jgi:hypothetical protein